MMFSVTYLLLMTYFLLATYSLRLNILMTTFPTIPRYICHETSGFQRVQRHHSGSVCQQSCKCIHACVGYLCVVSADMMSVRLMVGAGGAGFVLRASRDGFLRVARSRCAGQKQQTRAASAEVSVAEVL